MIIPVSDNKCGYICCTLHGIDGFKLRKKERNNRFNDILEFSLNERKETIQNIFRSIKIELNELQSFVGYSLEYSRYHFTLQEFKQYLVLLYGDDYPELIL